MSIRNQLACLGLFAVYIFVPTAQADDKAIEEFYNCVCNVYIVILKG